MATTTIYPSAVTVVGTAPTLVGAASNAAALDASTASYLQWASGALTAGTKIIATYSNLISSAIPADGVVLGIAPVMTAYSTAKGTADEFGYYRYVYPTSIMSVPAGRREISRPFMNVMGFTNSTNQTWNFPNHITTDEDPVEFWDDVILASSNTDLIIEWTVTNPLDAAGGTVRLLTAGLKVTAKSKPSVTASSLQVVGVDGSNNVEAANPLLYLPFSDVDESDGYIDGYRVVIGPTAEYYGLVANVDTNEVIQTFYEGQPTVYDSGYVRKIVHEDSDVAIIPDVLLPNTGTNQAYVRLYREVLGGAKKVFSDWVSAAAAFTNTRTPLSAPILLVENSAHRGGIRVRSWDGSAGATTFSYNTTREAVLERSYDGGMTWSIVSSQGMSLATKIMGLYSTDTSSSGGTSASVTARSDYLNSATKVRFEAQFTPRAWTPLATYSEAAIAGIPRGGTNVFMGLTLAGSDGTLKWYWPYNSTTMGSASSTVALNTVYDTATDTQSIRVRVDADHSSTNYSVKFYYSLDEGDTWTQLGATVTGSVATSGIYSSGAQATNLYYGNSGVVLASVGRLPNVLLEHVWWYLDPDDPRLVYDADLTLPPTGPERIGEVAYTYANNQDAYNLTRVYDVPRGRYFAQDSTVGGYWASGIDYLDCDVPVGDTVRYRVRHFGTSTHDTAGYTRAGTDATTSADVTFTLDVPWAIKVPQRPELSLPVELLLESLDSRYPKEQAIYKPIGATRFVALSDGVKGEQMKVTVSALTEAARVKLKEVYDSNLVVHLQGQAETKQTGAYYIIDDWDQKMIDTNGQVWEIDLGLVEADAPLL